MKCAAAGLLLLLLSSPAPEQDRRLVLLASRRVGSVEVLDPITLGLIGSIHVLPMADGMASSPDGTILYIREGIGPDFKGCCALYALSLETGRMTRLVAPAGGVAVSPEGDHLLTQRGNVGIEVYDGRTFERQSPVPGSIAPGVYGLSFSPNGQLLFGATNWPHASLDLFDFDSRELARRYPLAGDVTPLGAWLRGDFYLYAYHDAEGQLWKVNPQETALPVPLKVNFPDVAPDCAIHDENMFSAGNRLFLYEAFGGKGDRRLTCETSIPGGLFSIDPETGRVGRRLAADAHFVSLVANPGGKELYGIDVKHPNWDSVGLLRLDAEAGAILAKRELNPDVWSIDLVEMPREFVPHRQLEAIHD